MKCRLCILIAFALSAFGQQQPYTALHPSRVLADSIKGSSNVALTVYLVSGMAQAQPSGKDEVPQDLAETLQQLRGVFTYKSYRLLEAVTLRGRNFSGAEVQGALPDLTNYDFSYKTARISPEPPRIVHLDGLRLRISSRARADRQPDTIALVATDLDVQEGQKTVVGKSAVNATDAIFLVVVAKILD